MRNRGWQGDPPADDAEARDRILAAAMRCIDRYGATKTGLSDVAAELGVTRQTVYRLFSGTDDLFQAVSIAAADTFVDRLVASVRQLADPAEMLVECLAFTVEQLRQDRYLALVLDRGANTSAQSFTSQVPSDLTRALLARLPIDWRAHGVTPRRMNTLVEIYLRTLQSLTADPGPRRSGTELRSFLREWLAPAVSRLTGGADARRQPSIEN